MRLFSVSNAGEAFFSFPLSLLKSTLIRCSPGVRRFSSPPICHGHHVNLLRICPSYFEPLEPRSLPSQPLLVLPRYYSIVRPGHVQPPRIVPAHIARPNYTSVNSSGGGGILSKLRGRRSRGSAQKIEIKSDKQISGMREACRLARGVLDLVGSRASVGITTDELDRIAHEACLKRNAYPSPLNYKNFPKSICTSVNNVACHGIPDDRALEDGDIVNIDITVFYKGFHGDVSETFLIGDVSDDAQHLVNVARLCRDKAIDICRPGQRFNVIGQTISAIADEMKCGVIPQFCGHGIGSYFHGPPDIIHIDNDFGGVMQEGMTFTIEPIICAGSPEISVLEDGWTAVTNDNRLSAQFEHTILITNNGHDILTL